MIDFDQIDTYDNSLRDYQQKSKLEIYKEWEKYSSVMFQMPTGTGKTRLFVSIIKDIHNWSKQSKQIKRILVLAHREELIDQISDNLGPRYGIAHGIIKSGRESEPKYPVQVASVQTLIRRLDEWKKKEFDFIIIDEAHHSVADTYVTIVRSFPNAKVLGVSATPYRLSGSGFRHMYSSLVLSDSIKTFIDRGYLSNYEYYSIAPDSQTQIAIDNISEFDISGDYSEKAMLAICNTESVRANIIDSYFRHAKGKKGIIYTINRKHNAQVCQAFVDAGIVAEAIDSKTTATERKRIVSKFKNGDIQVLCNVNIFSEGFDCPDVEFIQLARPTKSLSMYLQQVGRGFRIHPNKESVIILDNVGTYNRFGLPSASRKWNHHFNGKGCVEESREFRKRNQSIGNVKDITEGDEDMQLIYSSIEEEQIEHMLDSENDVKVGKMIPYPIDPIGLLDRWEAEDCFIGLSDEHKEGFDIWSIEDTIKHNLHKPFSNYFYEKYENYDEWIETLEENLCLNSFLEENPDKESEYRRYIDSFYQVEVNDKWGIYDSNLKEFILAPLYDYIGVPDSDKNIICKKNGKYGLINYTNMHMVLPFIYDSIEGVAPQTHIVAINGLKGVMKNGKEILPLSYKYIELDNPYFFRYMFVSEEQYFYSSSNPQAYDRFYNIVTFNENNIFPLYGNYKYGIYESGHNERHYFILHKHTGKIALPFYFTNIIRNHNTEYPPIYCEHYGSYCFIDKDLVMQGKWIEGQFKKKLLKKNTSSFDTEIDKPSLSPGINIIDNKYLFADNEGKKLLGLEFDNISQLEEGLYLTELNGKYGIISYDGKLKYKVRPELDNVKLHNEIYLLYKDGKIGIADKRKYLVPEFESLELVGPNIYKCTKNDKVGAIRISEGFINWCISPVNDDIVYSLDGNILIYRDGKVGLKTNKNLYETIYDRIILLKHNYKVFEKDGVQKVGVENKLVQLPLLIDDFEHLYSDYYVIIKSGRKGVAKISTSFTLLKAPIYDDIEFSKDSKKITLKNNGKRPRFIELV